MYIRMCVHAYVRTCHVLIPMEYRVLMCVRTYVCACVHACSYYYAIYVPKGAHVCIYVCACVHACSYYYACLGVVFPLAVWCDRGRLFWACGSGHCQNNALRSTFARRLCHLDGAVSSHYVPNVRKFTCMYMWQS